MRGGRHTRLRVQVRVLPKGHETLLAVGRQTVACEENLFLFGKP